MSMSHTHSQLSHHQVMQMDNSPLDMKQLFMNNLLLLGFDVPAMEAANHVPFNKSMFELPNRRAAEIVLYFLFQRLNQTMCREAFRDCWPILDKKREQIFRKTCSNWLTNISQEETDSQLPRINASLFMSPGGDKFYQLMFRFSSYVLRKVTDTELGCKPSDRLKYPTVTSQNIQHWDAMVKDMKCSSIRHRKRFLNLSQQILKANQIWKETANESVQEYRKLKKAIRELEYKIRDEEQRSMETSVARGSPARKRSQQDQFDPEFDPRTIKRAQRIQQVREMWSQLDAFDSSEAAEREVIESIVERTLNRHQLDAAEISVKVPDMLLRECGEEIRRRNVDNTYQGGRLNLVSVIQLWNLCLHLYLEKIQQVGVPRFEADVKKLTSQVHTQQNYLQTAMTLREEMSSQIPEMKASVEELRDRLDSAFFGGNTPETIRTTSVGLALVEPSPLPSFSPTPGGTPAEGLHVPRSPTEVCTPEAAARITEDVVAAVRKGPAQLFGDKEDPVLENVRLVTEDRSREDGETLIPRPAASQKSSRSSQQSSQAGSRHTSQPGSRQSSRPTSQPGSRQSSRPTSARSTASTIGSRSGSTGDRKVETSSSRQVPVAHGRQFDTDLDHSHARAASPPTLIGSYRLDDSNNSCSSGPGRKTPTDMLVDEIMGEAEVISPYLGSSAFVTREIIVRTPELDEEEEEQQEEEEEEDKENRTPTNEDILEVRGPDIPESGDESDVSEKSQEDVIVIDRSIHQSPLQDSYSPREQQPFTPPREAGSLEPVFSPGEPGIDMEEFPDLDGSPLIPGTGIVIDRSFQQPQSEFSPGDYDDQEEKQSLNQSVGSRSAHRSAGRRSFSEERGSFGASPGSQHSSGKAEWKRDTSFSAEELESMKARFSHTSFTEDVRSPLKDEIRRMYKEAMADQNTSNSVRSPRQAEQPSENNGSPGGMENGKFLSQVELEDLVIGDNIVRRDSDYFASSGYLSQQFRDMRDGQDGDQAEEWAQETPAQRVQDILKNAKSMEEKLLGKGTPLDSPQESVDELELPNMDLNSRQELPDPEPDGNVVGSADWNLDEAENLDDIEMPDMMLEGEDGDMCLGSPVNVNAQASNDSLDDFFETKTPELPKRGTQLVDSDEGSRAVQGASLESEGTPRPPRFPQLALEDEVALMTFTP